MIGAVVRKELCGFLRDGRLLLLAISILCILAGVLAISIDSSAQAQRERDSVGATVQAQWATQGVKNPHRAAHFGIYVFKPALALTALDPGIGEQVGQALWLEPHKRNLTRNSRSADAPVSEQLGEKTPIFVLLALVPLLIIGLGHNAVSQERESGTLRMSHAAGLAARQLLVGKWLAVLAATAVVMLPALLFAVWLMASSLSPDETLRLAAIVLALAVYYATIAALAIAVSARLRTSRGALLLLLALWIAALWVVPRLGAAAARAALPATTGLAFATAVADDIRDGLPGDGNADSRLAAFEERLLAEHRVATLADLPVGANAARRLFRDAYAAKVYAVHFDALWDRYAAQQAVLRWMGLVSPAVSMHAISSAMAGNDLAHQHHFEEAAEAYRQTFTAQIDEWDLNARRGVVSAEDKYGDDAVWQAVRPFAYRMPGMTDALRQAWPDLLILLAWLAGALVFLFRSARKVES